MRSSNKLSYIALGGLLILIGRLASRVFMPILFAQRGKFGEIECTSLTVVDERGSVKIGLGSVAVFGKGKRQAAIGINKYGNGDVSTWDKHGYRQREKRSASDL